MNKCYICTFQVLYLTCGGPFQTLLENVKRKCISIVKSIFAYRSEIRIDCHIQCYEKINDRINVCSVTVRVSRKEQQTNERVSQIIKAETNDTDDIKIKQLTWYARERITGDIKQILVRKSQGIGI